MMADSGAPAVDVNGAKEMARQVIAHHFGSKPRRVDHLASGLSNFVFMVHHAEGDFVVRLSPEQAKLQAFIKEQWAMAQAREVGVPTPEILEVGNAVVPTPYMVSRRVVGQEATFHPKRGQIIREMGKYAALINSVRTTGFGWTFDWSSNQLSRNETFGDFLSKELQTEARLEILKKHKMLLPAQLKRLRATLRQMAGWDRKPSLTHGDMRLKNMIVNNDGQIVAVIDWEDSVSCVAPHWELSLALHDLSIDEKQEFLEAYGMREKKVAEVAPFLKALNLINYAPEIERLAEVKDTARLEAYRTRLSGVLDLYSL